MTAVAAATATAAAVPRVGPLSRFLASEASLPIVALVALNAADEFDTQTFTILGPEISAHFHVGAGFVGLMTALSLILGTVLSLPVGRLGDKRNRMQLAIAGAVCWGAFSLLTGAAWATWVLVVARLGSGLGKVVNAPVHGSLIADFYSPKARIKAFGLHALANVAGVVTAAAFIGLLFDLTGFRGPFFVLTIPTVVAIVLSYFVKEPARGVHENKDIVDTRSLADAARRLWAIRSLRYQWFGAAYTGGAILGIGPLVPFFLKDEFGVSPGGRGLITGAGVALSAIAVVGGTILMQRRLEASPGQALRLLVLSGFIACAAMVGIAVSPALVTAVLCIWIVVAVFAFVAPGLNAITALVAPPELRASAYAVGGIVALAGVPFALVGYAIGVQSSIRTALVVMAPVFLRGLFHFLTACKHLDDDVARLSGGASALAARAAVDPEGRGRAVLLEADGICVSYGGVQVLFDVGLHIYEGEILALLGTNGAGKSTILNAISGVTVPDAGNVWFDGEPITGEAPEHTAARGVVQVPGGKGIFPGLTVRENLQMGGFLLRRDRVTLAARTAEVLDLFPRLVERIDQPAGALSGGERQMLTLAQSFLLKPRLLLIDELSLGLAPAVVGELLESVRALNSAGCSVVVVEQSVNVALTLATRAYFMEKGEVRFDGLTHDLLARPDLLRSVFLEGAGAALSAGDAVAPPTRRAPRRIG